MEEHSPGAGGAPLRCSRQHRVGTQQASSRQVTKSQQLLGYRTATMLLGRCLRSTPHCLRLTSAVPASELSSRSKDRPRS